MILDSSIIQLDVHEHYLLVSTLTKSYICNTNMETYCQIGMKPRQGVFGACFCQIDNSSRRSEEEENHCNNNFNSVGNFETRIFCARPGFRIWEANFKGFVLSTHQLRQTVESTLTTTINLNEDKCEEEETHPISSQGSNPSIRKIIRFYDNYLLAYSIGGLYIIDPQRSKIIHGLNIDEGINQLRVFDNIVLYLSKSGTLNKLIMTTLDFAILKLHTKQLYYSCTHLILENRHMFKQSFVLKQFGSKILADLSSKITEDNLRKRIEDLRRSLLPYPIQCPKSPNTDVPSVTVTSPCSLSSSTTEENLNNAEDLKKYADSFGSSFDFPDSSLGSFRSRKDSSGFFSAEGKFYGRSVDSNIFYIENRTKTNRIEDLSTSFVSSGKLNHSDSKQEVISEPEDEEHQDFNEILLEKTAPKLEKLKIDENPFDLISENLAHKLRSYISFINKNFDDINDACTTWLTNYVEIVQLMKEEKLELDSPKISKKLFSPLLKKETSKFFLTSFKKNVTIELPLIHNFERNGLHKIPKHPLTPESFREIDQFYAILILNGQQLLDDEFLIDNILEPFQNLPVLSWISLAKRSIQREEGTLPTFLEDLKHSNTLNQLDTKLLLIAFLVQQCKDLIDMKSFDFTHFALQYLNQFNKEETLKKIYLSCFGYKELQYDLIRLAIDSNLDKLLEIIFQFPLHEPESIRHLCYEKKFIPGITSLVLKYPTHRSIHEQVENLIQDPKCVKSIVIESFANKTFTELMTETVSRDITEESKSDILTKLLIHMLCYVDTKWIMKLLKRLPYHITQDEQSRKR